MLNSPTLGAKFWKENFTFRIHYLFIFLSSVKLLILRKIYVHFIYRCSEFWCLSILCNILRECLSFFCILKVLWLQLVVCPFRPKVLDNFKLKNLPCGMIPTKMRLMRLVLGFLRDLTWMRSQFLIYDHKIELSLLINLLHFFNHVHA